MILLTKIPVKVQIKPWSLWHWLCAVCWLLYLSSLVSSNLYRLTSLLQGWMSMTLHSPVRCSVTRWITRMGSTSWRWMHLAAWFKGHFWLMYSVDRHSRRSSSRNRMGKPYAYTPNWAVALFLSLLHPPGTLYLMTFDCVKTFSLSNATWKPIYSNSLSPPVLHQAPLYLRT